MHNDEDDRSQVIPDWIIKLLAAAFVTGAITWATFETSTTYTHGSQIAVMQKQQDGTDRSLVVINEKLDNLTALANQQLGRNSTQAEKPESRKDILNGH